MCRTFRICILVLCLVASACVGWRKAELHPYQGSAARFTHHEVLGWRYELISMSSVFSLAFKDGGYAPATTGSGETLAAPIYQWDIDKDGCLRISNDEGTLAIYQLISMKGNSAVLWDQTKGRSSVFRRERLKP
jgi:hypothetical protein